MIQSKIPYLPYSTQMILPVLIIDTICLKSRYRKIYSMALGLRLLYLREDLQPTPGRNWSRSADARIRVHMILLHII